jgi:hypothetical protein
MVDTIAPVVHGGSRRRWAAALALHVVGATISATVLGGLLGAAGSALGAPWGVAGTAVMVVVALAYAAREAVGLPVPIPDARRQVPQWWRESFFPGTTAFLYGAGLGVGFATHLRHGTLVAVAAVVLAAGDPAFGMAAFSGFGLARSVGVAVTWTSTDGRGAARLSSALERAAVGPWPRLANGAALFGVAVVALAARTQPDGSIGPAPAVFLAAVFAAAAATKLFRPRVWTSTVAEHRLPPLLEAGATAGVPLAEAAIPVLVVAGAARAGAAAALVLLMGFSAALLRLRSMVGDGVPCGCFGRRRSRDVRLLLLRNAGIALVAGVALAGPDRISVEPPGSTEVVPAVLAAVGAGLAVLLLRRASALVRSGPGTAEGA